MKSIKTLALAGALAFASVISPALGAGFFTNGVPPAGGTQYPNTIPLTGNEGIPADTNLPSGLNPASEAISTNQLVGFWAGQPSRGNALIGGDAGTNLWQRGTGGTQTTSATPAYDGPDRFAQWSATSAGVTVSRSSASTDIPTGYAFAIKMAHTNTTGGQICIGQVVESVNSTQFQGTTAELDFHAYTGAGFTGTTNNMTAYIYTGTGTDEGISAMAGGTWAGQATATAAVVNLGGVSTAGRYAAVAAIPVTTKEIGVALCYTASTTDTNDYVAVDGVQLLRNPANAAYASATVGLNATLFPAASFERRSQALETELQQRYYWSWAETASSHAAAPAMCSAQSSTVAVCQFQLPTTLRTTPTIAYTAGTLQRMVAGTDTTVSACAAAATTNGVSSAGVVNITATVASGDTAGFSGVLKSGNSTGGGLVTASAEE